MRSKSQKGFSLVEVLVFIGLIGLVTALTAPAVLRNRNERIAREAAQKAAQIVTPVVPADVPPAPPPAPNYPMNGGRYVVESVSYLGGHYVTVIRDTRGQLGPKCYAWIQSEQNSMYMGEVKCASTTPEAPH